MFRKNNIGVFIGFCRIEFFDFRAGKNNRQRCERQKNAARQTSVCLCNG